MNGIDYIAQILKQEGVEWMSCFPSNPLISAVARVGIRPIAFRHERGAVMAADGYSRISDRQKFGVCAVQSQAGAENAMGGIAQAYADNIPILVFLGGNVLDRLSVRPNFTAARNYQGWVKQVEAIYTPNQVGDVMRRAFHALRNGTPGLVVVELVADVCAQEVPEAARTYKSPKIHRQVPEASAIEEAAAALGASPTRVFFEVTLPLIRPGVFAGGVFTFIVSFDQFPVSLFLVQPKNETLPVVLFNYMKFDLDGAIAAARLWTLDYEDIPVALDWNEEASS